MSHHVTGHEALFMQTMRSLTQQQPAPHPTLSVRYQAVRMFLLEQTQLDFEAFSARAELLSKQANQALEAAIDSAEADAIVVRLKANLQALEARSHLRRVLHISANELLLRYLKENQHEAFLRAAEQLVEAIKNH